MPRGGNSITGVLWGWVHPLQKPNTCSCFEFQAPRKISAAWWNEQH